LAVNRIPCWRHVSWPDEASVATLTSDATVTGPAAAAAAAGGPGGGTTPLRRGPW